MEKKTYTSGVKVLQSIQRYGQYQRPIAWPILFWPNPSLNSHSLWHRRSTKWTAQMD
jgi:hypothetical protein